MTLDVQREGGVSTKGPRGGVFVMYNCARLHTLFDSYERGVEKGERPVFKRGFSYREHHMQPKPLELDFTRF